ncbi:hypothetical protein [Actinosynnema sp. NPDC020468]
MDTELPRLRVGEQPANPRPGAVGADAENGIVLDLSGLDTVTPTTTR